MIKAAPSELELAALKFAQAKAAMEDYANDCAAKETPVDRKTMLALIATWRGAQFDLIERARQFTGEAA